MRIAFLTAWLLPAAVLAQSSTIAITSTSATGTTPTVLIGKAACQANTAIPFTVDLGAGNSTATGTVTFGILKSGGSCNGSTSAFDKTLPAPSFNGQTASVTLTPSDIYLDTPDGGAFDCNAIARSSSAPATYQVCVRFTTTSLLSSTPVGAEVPVSFATLAPTPPGAPAVTAGDAHLRVSWSPGNASETIATYDVHVLPTGGTVDPAKYAARVSAQTNADVSHTDDGTGLQNDAGYDVSVRATDTYGNASALSAVSQGSPQPVSDFYDQYRRDGGTALGGQGCSTGGGVAWIAALAFAVALLARKRRAAVASLLLFGISLALPAHAAWQQPPRRVLVELKVDRYNPAVDSEASLGGRTPYTDVFGSRRPLRYQLEADWEIAHPFGSLLLGATAGYWQNIGKGVVDAGLPTQHQSQDTALLDVIPFGVVATYRFDWLADNYRWFPFIPYAQAGLTRALWASFAGTGSVSHTRVDGRRGSGWTKGYTTALGVAVNLNAIDPDVAREAYSDTAIQRTAVFAEYGWTRLDDFRRTGALILSDRGWRFGLSLEF